MAERTCCGQEHALPDDERIAALQVRLDRIFSGLAYEGVQLTADPPEVFAPFNPADQEAADGLAMLCEKVAHRIGGLDGLEAAIDELYAFLPSSPVGQVDKAARLFLTHYPPARRSLRIPSLEARQAATAGLRARATRI